MNLATKNRPESRGRPRDVYMPRIRRPAGRSVRHHVGAEPELSWLGGGWALAITIDTED